MSDNRQKEARVEGTQFYRTNALLDILRIVIVTVVALAAISIFSLWAIADAGARRAYKEARDIRRALRIVGTEYYGDMTSIYDPRNADGLVDGAAEKIAEISTRDGEVTLISWDQENNAPIQFEYIKGPYRVVYTDMGETANVSSGVEGDFTVYYTLEILSFDAE